MKHLVLALCAVSLLATPALSQSIGEKTGVNAMIGIAPKTEDFVKEAAVSDMFEIQSSELAKTKAQDARIKSFAEMMVTDHTKTSEELKGLVSGGKVKAEIPAAMDDAHKSKLEKLKGLNGKHFDEQYADDQQAAHKDAVSLFERYSKGGDNAELKAFAGKHLPHLQEHLKMAQELDKKPAATVGKK